MTISQIPHNVSEADMGGLIIQPAMSQIIVHDQVRVDYDWMTVTISLRPHKCHENGGEDRVGLALCVNSSFGCFGYEWYNIGANGRADAIKFLANQTLNELLSKILKDDAPTANFEKTHAAFLSALSHEIECLAPTDQRAQELREIFVQSQDEYEQLDDNFCDEHKVERLMTSSYFWDAFPEGNDDIRQEGISFRRREAEGFFYKIWTPYIQTLADTGRHLPDGPS